MSNHIPYESSHKNMRFKEAFAAFSSYLESNKRTPDQRKRYSPNTVEKYREECRHFGEFLQGEFPDVWEDVGKITPRHLLAYQEFQQRKISCYSGQPLRERTVCIRMAVAKAMCKYLTLVEVIAKDPTRGIFVPMPEPTDPREIDGILTVEEFNRRVREFIENSKGRRQFESIRNVTLCRLLFATGLRIRAALGITRKDIDLKENRVRAKEKGGRICTKFFDEQTAEQISALIEHMDNNLPGLNNHHLFVTRQARRHQGEKMWEYRQMHYNVALDAVHLVVGVSPHKLRHSFALACVERGADPFTLMNLMGHANVATTSIYMRKNEEMMQEDYGKFAPFS